MATPRRRLHGLLAHRHAVPAIYIAAAILAALAGWATGQVSVVLGLVIAAAIIIATVRTVHGAQPLKTKAREANDKIVISMCKSGMVSGARNLYRVLPTDPRCRLCLLPFKGVGRLLGARPSRKNPNFCPS